MVNENNDEKQRKVKFYALIIVAVLLVAVAGVSFAYFVASLLGDGTSDVEVQTEAVNKIVFNESAPIEIFATEDNFGENDGSLSASGESTAVYVAEAGTTTQYDVNFNIASNNFVYTQNATTPELILNLTGPAGEITSITGLTYVTVIDSVTGKEIKGFDITNKVGLYNIVTDLDIVADGSAAGVEHAWNAAITFVNLNTNQALNEGKDLVATLVLE